MAEVCEYSGAIYRCSPSNYVLLDAAQDIFVSNDGYEEGRRGWPEIIESDDTPQLVRRVSPNWDGKWDTLIDDWERKTGSVEIVPIYQVIGDLLGLYITDPVRIILFRRTIESYSRYLNVSVDDLRAAVLVHEFAHWITHLLPSSALLTWEISGFIGSSCNLKEGWAELVCEWVARSSTGGFKEAFEKKSTDCAKTPGLSPYQIYRKFTKYDIEHVVKSLAELRSRNIVPSFEHWYLCLLDVAIKNENIEWDNNVSVDIF